MGKVDLVRFRDVDGTLRPFIPSAVLYPDTAGENSRYGFEALYRAREGTCNLKTGFKIDMVSPPSPLELQKLYRVFTDGKEVVKAPHEVLEDFLSYVIRETLRSIEASTNNKIRNVGIVLSIPATIENEVLQNGYREQLRNCLKRIFGALANVVAPVIQTAEILFYEPLAVYKYYLDEKEIPKHEGERHILIFDWGGGTLNLCGIKTTPGGEVIAKFRGSLAVPTAVDGIKAGGTVLDKILVDILFEKEPKNFRDEVKNCHRDMLEVERKKIELVRKLVEGEEERPETRIDLRGKKAYLTIEMIEGAFKTLWDKSIQPKIEFLTDRLKRIWKIHRLDLAILAGGSSRIPFLRSAIQKALQLDEEHVILGRNFEQAVGCGLSYVAREKLEGLGGEEPEQKLVAFISDDVYLLAGGKSIPVFPKDSSLEWDESASAFCKRWEYELGLPKPATKLIATYTEELPVDNVEFVLNQTIKRVDLPRKLSSVRVALRCDEDGYTQASYGAGDDVFGTHDFYLGVGKLSQWIVDAAIGIDIGTTNTAVAYYTD
jgi:hypothetical protein